MAFEKKTIDIKVDVYEGPLDLLLSLIAKEEVEIADIPIIKITDQYLAIMADMKELDLDLTSEFLVMAATLIEIKSKMLLPNQKLEDGDAQYDTYDPREELIQRLLTYKAFKEAAIQLQEKEGHLDEVVLKEQEELSTYTRTLSNEELNASLEVVLLEEAVKRIISKMNRFDENRKQFFKKIKRDLYTVDEKIQMVTDRLEDEGVLRFSALFGDAPMKEEVVVTFLAVLELLKLKRIRIMQKALFDDIQIIKREDEDSGE